MLPASFCGRIFFMANLAVMAVKKMRDGEDLLEDFEMGVVILLGDMFVQDSVN